MYVKRKLIVWQAHEGNVSGANIAMLEYVDALSSVYDFHVLLPHKGSMQAALTKRSIAFTVIPQYGWAGDNAGNLRLKIKRGVRSLLALRSTIKLLQALEADFVFTNTLIPFVAAKAANYLQLPHVWWIHEFGREDFGFGIGLGNEKKAYERIARWSKLIICNSNAVMGKFKPLLPSVSIERIYQPVSWKPANFLKHQKKATYLMFGQITSSKGHMEVLESVFSARQKGFHVQLDIKGPCENKQYLKELQDYIDANQLNDQVLIETGFFIKEEVMPCYEVLIMASRAEAFGRVIIEAHKAGLKVLVKNSGGAVELINETNGLIYSCKAKLVSFFCGELSMPAGAITLAYNEEEEIVRLKNILESITVK